jgi:hypothetical protein
MTVFADPLTSVYGDPDHSSHEDRFLLVGRSFAERTLIVVHAQRGNVIRIITSRRANPAERRRYEGAN